MMITPARSPLLALGSDIKARIPPSPSLSSRNTLWNADGLLEDAGAYPARINAQISAWLRPSFVTPNTDNDYLSVFVADETAPWVTHHNMNPRPSPDVFQPGDATGLLLTPVTIFKRFSFR
jgi:hypothetical protein